MCFQYRASKATSNLKKRRVSFADFEGSILALHREDRDAEGEERLVAMELGSAGQRLVVLYRVRGNDIRIISARRATRSGRYASMRAEYDFSEAQRGTLLSSEGKTRIKIYIDNAVLDEFRARAEQARTGYRTMMNAALKGYLAISEVPVTESVLRLVIREELPQVQPPTRRSPVAAKRTGERGIEG